MKYDSTVYHCFLILMKSIYSPFRLIGIYPVILLLKKEIVIFQTVFFFPHGLKKSYVILHLFPFIGGAQNNFQLCLDCQWGFLML